MKPGEIYFPQDPFIFNFLKYNANTISDKGKKTCHIIEYSTALLTQKGFEKILTFLINTYRSCFTGRQTRNKKICVGLINRHLQAKYDDIILDMGG